MEQISDNPVVNSMATSNSTHVPEESTTLNFGDWVYVADGSDSITSHLAAHTAPKAKATMHNKNSSNIANTDDSQVFYRSKNHSVDLASTTHPRIGNSDLIDGKDSVLSNNPKDVNLGKTTPNRQGSEPATKQKIHTCIGSVLPDINQIENSFGDRYKSLEEVLESEAKVYNIRAAEFNHDFDEFLQTLDDIDPFNDSDNLGDYGHGTSINSWKRYALHHHKP